MPHLEQATAANQTNLWQDHARDIAIHITASHRGPQRIRLNPRLALRGESVSFTVSVFDFISNSDSDSDSDFPVKFTSLQLSCLALDGTGLGIKNMLRDAMSPSRSSGNENTSTVSWSVCQSAKLMH